jgi:hypothetical protein
VKAGDWEDRPDSWHICQVAGTYFQIDKETRKEIETWIKGLKYPDDYFATLDITSVIGEDITIIASAVNIFYNCSPEIRLKSRELSKLVADERMGQGFPNDD